MDLGHDHSSKWRGESRKASKPLRSNMNPNWNVINVPAGVSKAPPAGRMLIKHNV